MVELFVNRVFLLDIEGTTTSISYVKDILFPFFLDNLVNHIETNWSDQQLQDDIDLLKKQSIEDASRGLVDEPLPDDSNNSSFKTKLVDYINKLVSIDSKCTALKQLQGHIWKHGFESGQIKGHVYDDVLPALKQWKQEYNIDIYIYSSGSIEAQKLHFGHTIHGNLLPFISGHFDTTIGPKQELLSYQKIAEELKVSPKDIVFLTDVDKEAIAANKTGMTSVIVLRPGNKEIDPNILAEFPTIKSFDQITFKKNFLNT